MLQKARKTAQLVKPSSNKRNTPQAMVVSSGEQRRKTDGREYDTPPPIPCTPKDLDVLLDKWIADGVFKPNQVSREPTEEERRDPHFCHLHNYVQHPTTECWVLRRLVRHRIKEGTLELSHRKSKETHSQTTNSNDGNLCRSRGRRRVESSPACRSNLHLTVKLQIQKFL